MFITIICASNEENALLAGAFDEYRDSRKALRRNCHGQSFEKADSVFEEPFWVGVFECVSDGKLSVCKVTFGAEPKDYEIYNFVLKYYYQLRFSPAVATDVKEASRNPKRVQREVRKQMQNTGIGTKSQQALKLQQEQLKIE